MASVSPLIYCSLYTGSMPTNQPAPVDRVVPDDRKKKRLSALRTRQVCLSRVLLRSGARALLSDATCSTFYD